MSKIITIDDQTIFDIAIQEYGTLTAVSEIIANNQIESLDANFEAGTILTINDKYELAKKDISNYLKFNLKNITTGGNNNE